jgi:integrase
MNPRYKRGQWFTVRVPHPDGGSVAKSARTREPDVAKAIERMLADLYDRPKYHPILRAILPRKGLQLPKVYAAWIADGMDALLASLSDVDLATYIGEWERHLASRFGKYEWEATDTGLKRHGETTRQYTRQVRSLVEHAGGTVLRSNFTPRLVSPWLASLTVKPPTRRRYYAAVHQFADYLVTIRVLERNPLAEMKAPPSGSPRDRHLMKAEWLKLIDHQAEPYRTASVLAHLGIELGVIPTIRRRDVDLKARTVHARGTKRAWRNRLAYIYDWALPYLTRACQMQTPTVVLVPRSVEAIRSAHDTACEALGINNYRIHDARHSIAVWLVSAGTPYEVVAAQLGHQDTGSVQDVYGKYKPRTEDAARWAKIAEERDLEAELGKQKEAVK